MIDYRKKCLSQKEEKCDVCGAEEQIEVHHIDGDRGNNNIENLIPLCKDHHLAVHRGDEEVYDLVDQLETIDRGTMVKVTVSLDQYIHTYLEEWAGANNQNFSEAVRTHLRDSMDSDGAHQTVEKLSRAEEEVDFLREVVLKAVEE
jgi:Arc/MetJ-type ribon-helix-helix transcriptional regulator